ncbi:hypothetical protein HYW17_00060 [Candidatus Uhrbacteria bacterium]|nr:hypothetical protein [Candidatus Uhrbacteria bacterium]
MVQLRLDNLAKRGKVHPLRVLEVVAGNTPGVDSVEQLLNSPTPDNPGIVDGRALAIYLMFQGNLCDIALPDLAGVFGIQLMQARLLYMKIARRQDAEPKFRADLQQKVQQLQAAASGTAAIPQTTAPPPAADGEAPATVHDDKVDMGIFAADGEPIDKVEKWRVIFADARLAGKIVDFANTEMIDAINAALKLLQTGRLRDDVNARRAVERLHAAGAQMLEIAEMFAGETPLQEAAGDQHGESPAGQVHSGDSGSS